MESKKQSVFVLFIIFSVINSSCCLRCYMCSTDAIDGQFCKDPFNKDKLTEQQKMFSDKECKPQGNLNLEDASQFKPVCKKLVQDVNGHEVIQRQCYFQDIHDSNDRCAHDETPAHIKTKFCQTCDKDYCNNADVFTPPFMLVLIPTLIVSVFSW